MEQLIQVMDELYLGTRENNLPQWHDSIKRFFNCWNNTDFSLSIHMNLFSLLYSYQKFGVDFKDRYVNYVKT